MGVLTTYLQTHMSEHLPPGWSVATEESLLPVEWRRLLGYNAKADVVLTPPDGDRRIWVEFEVSRADPVANHAKFATSHLFQPFPQTDVFVSMVSPHVLRGRRNLAANAIRLMRHVGMTAFQTTLFPHLSPSEIATLNHSELAVLNQTGPDVAPEVERVFAVVDPVTTTPEWDVHLCGELFEVFLNARRWNEEIGTPAGEAWKGRTVTYFVLVPGTDWFAPSKFCAYCAIQRSNNSQLPTAAGTPTLGMSIATYCAINDGTHQFDGHQAQTHLVRRLGMQSIRLDDHPDIAERFSAWTQRHADSVRIHPNGATILIAPEWFS